MPWMRVLCVLVATSLMPSAWAADKPDPLAPVAWMVGEWAGVAEGEPGRSAAQRRIVRDINGRFLRAEGRSVYPRQEKNPRGEVHVALDLWSYDRKRQALVLRQFDSLGFVTTYVQQPGEDANTLVLLAEHLENVPSGWKARYTYTLVPPDEFRELFELDADGSGFKTYVDGRYLRVSP